jgi:hypothetical protein
MEEGRAIVHSTFGTGTVVHVGEYKGAPGVWIDFDRGDRKLLDPVSASRYVRLRTARDKATRVARAIRCDLCGRRPVIVTIAAQNGTEQFCEAHQVGS